MSTNIILPRPAVERVPIYFDIRFSTNWNGKLSNTCFTSIRISNSFVKGTEYNVMFCGQCIGQAVVLEKIERRLDTLQDWICFQDTGYDAEETKKILKTMYAKSNIDWARQPLYIMLFKFC